jgi:type III pantothenate kinase
MTEWIVDQGNTRLKLGVFEGGALAEVLTDAAAVAWMEADWEEADQILVAASGSLAPELETALAARTRPVLHAARNMPLPVALDYGTPETLGWDRIANAAAVTARDPEAVWAVIDAGTCITCDLVAGGTFFGGSIAPGIDLRLRAMYAGTAALPLIEDWRERLGEWNGQPESTLPEHVGTSTVGSLVAGAWGGARAELAGRLADFGKRWPDLQVMWTGGDADYLHERDSGLIFADSNLTLHGYHAILQHQR